MIFWNPLTPKCVQRYWVLSHCWKPTDHSCESYSKFIGDGIFEIRAKQSSNITRVLYFFYIGKRIVLTNGFIKKTQKTPPEEIALAKKYRADYLERKEKIS